MSYFLKQFLPKSTNTILGSLFLHSSWIIYASSQKWQCETPFVKCNDETWISMVQLWPTKSCANWEGSESLRRTRGCAGGEEGTSGGPSDLLLLPERSRSRSAHWKPQPSLANSPLTQLKPTGRAKESSGSRA